MTSSSIFPSHPSPNHNEHLALIALSMVPRVGPNRLHALVQQFGSARRVMTLPVRVLCKVEGVGPKTARAVTSFDDFDAVEEQLERASRSGAELLAPSDEGFPARLLEIYDPPPFFWMRGRLTERDDPALAVVGTRKASKYGMRVARRLAGGLAERGITVVSGLAYGIDTVAHTSALDAGGRTVAVLGSGVDRIYPQANHMLARRIVKRGALLSEYPLGTAPEAGNFPERNRLISGMTVGTVVVESGVKGGALITAYMALEQNREVFAVPGSIYSRVSRGTHRLIKKGHAKLVADVNDVLEDLAHVFPPAAPSASRGRTQQQPVEPELSGAERRLYDVLTEQPVHLDVLCRKAGLDSSTALVHLLNLEFEGLVHQMAGKQFYRAGI